MAKRGRPPKAITETPRMEKAKRSKMCLTFSQKLKLLGWCEAHMHDIQNGMSKEQVCLKVREDLMLEINPNHLADPTRELGISWIRVPRGTQTNTSMKILILALHRLYQELGVIPDPPFAHLVREAQNADH